MIDNEPCFGLNVDRQTEQESAETLNVWQKFVERYNSCHSDSMRYAVLESQHHHDVEDL